MSNKLSCQSSPLMINLSSSNSLKPSELVSNLNLIHPNCVSSLIDPVNLEPIPLYLKTSQTILMPSK